jgi:hypothetical protein
MGNRKYFNLVIRDTLQEEQNGKVGDKDNIVSLRDYMQVRIWFNEACTLPAEYILKYLQM